MPDLVRFGRRYVIQPDAHPDTLSIRNEVFSAVRTYRLVDSPGNHAWLLATLRRAGLSIATIDDVRDRKRAPHTHRNDAA